MLCSSSYKSNPVNRIRTQYIKIKTFGGVAELDNKLTEQRAEEKKAVKQKDSCAWNNNYNYY